MWLVLLALDAELLEFQAILENLLILGRTVVQGLTNRTLEFDQGILGHTSLNKCCRAFSFGLFSAWRIGSSLDVHMSTPRESSSLRTENSLE